MNWKLLFTFLAFATFFTANAQIHTPVSWEFSKENITDTEYYLIFTAHIDEGWVVYSQNQDSDDGPVPTSFEYDSMNGFQLIGNNEEHGHSKTVYDKIFEMNLTKLSGIVQFKQKVKVNSGTKSISGYLTYMTCDDEKCLPPQDVDFDFSF